MASKRSAYYEGILYAMGAFAWWGLAPLFWKLLPGVPPEELLAQRVIWSFVFLLPVLRKRNRRQALMKLFSSDRKDLGLLFMASVLIGFNWYLYMYAMAAHRVLDASLGYFLTPLMSVFLGVVLFREKINELQIIAIAIAGISILFLTSSLEKPPFLALLLSSSFAFYGYFKARTKVSGALTVLVETLLLSPVMLVYLYQEQVLSSGHHSWQTWAILFLTGPFTTFPLIWYSSATQRIPYSVVGFLQYLSPIIQFALAILMFHEPFGMEQKVTFALIWVALGIFTFDLSRRVRSKSKNSGFKKAA